MVLIMNKKERHEVSMVIVGLYLTDNYCGIQDSFYGVFRDLTEVVK